MSRSPSVPLLDDNERVAPSGGRDLESSLLDRISQDVRVSDAAKPQGIHLPTKVNMDALEGLRGAAACWIVIFHGFREYRGSDVDFQGSSLMPLFFLLTGFSLATTYNHASCKTFWPFYWNRVVRVVPVYYLLSLATVPMWNAGFGDAPWGSGMYYSVGTTATMSSTMLLFLYGSPLDGPSWTVQTFMWMWLLFPWLMNRTRKMTSATLTAWLVRLYYLQLVLICAIFPAVLYFTSWGFWPAFCAATMHPLSRLPLMLMGMYAGELCHRASSGEAALVEYHATGRRSVVLWEAWPESSLYMWPCSSCCCRPRSVLTSSSSSSQSPELSVLPDSSLQLQQREQERDSADGAYAAEEALWTSLALKSSLGLLLLTMLVSAANTLSRQNISGALWFQAIVPHWQLTIIVALTRQSTRSLLHRALTTSLARYLGRISMTIYLCHYPIIWYVEWGINGYTDLAWPSGAKKEVVNPDSSVTDDDTQAGWDKARQLPLYGIALVLGITLAVSVVVHHCFEEPVRRALRRAQ